MKPSISVIRKKKRGRPATGVDPVLAIRIPEAVIEQIDEWAATAEMTRSEAIRMFIENGLTLKAKQFRRDEPT